MKKLLALLLVCTMILSLAMSVSAEDLKGKKVSLLTANLSSVTTNQMAEYMKKGLEEHGIEVTVVDTKGDFGQLASRIEDSVSAKADAIVLISADPVLVLSQLEVAFEAGVPVFGCDSGFVEGMQVNATSDNYMMGEAITRYLFDDLMGGKGTVIALTHRPHPGVVKRSNAFDDIIKEYPDIKLITEQHVEVPGPIESARTIMENLLLSNSAKDSVTAVWCAWDEPAIGATQALMDAGRGEVFVTGVDGNSQAVELINEDSNLKATMAQNFEGMANIVVTEVVKLFSGEEVIPGEQYAPALLITKTE
jgi:ribose transport system substrate-binding protein